MDKVFNNICRFINDVGGSAGKFSPETWATIAVASVILGYFLLKGNVLKGG